MKNPVFQRLQHRFQVFARPLRTAGQIDDQTLPRMPPPQARQANAFGVIRMDAALIASGIPKGREFCRTAIVASGVTSRSAKPVPPVVTISAMFSSSAARMSSFRCTRAHPGTSTISPHLRAARSTAGACILPLAAVRPVADVMTFAV